MDTLLKIVQTINMYLSDYVLIILLLGAGLYFTIRTKFVQFRCFGEGWRRIFGDFSLRGGVREGCRETLAYTDFPMQHWTRIRTNNAIERLNREIRRRTRVVGTFPDGKSALMLVTARLKYIVENEWGRRRYLDVSLLEDEEGKA